MALNKGGGRTPVPVRISIRYVEGTSIEVAADEWPQLRGDGIDSVDVIHTGRVRIAFASLYWLYRERDAWVAGWGSVHYDPNPLREILFHPDGRQTEREREFMPDLPHSAVKLGWWWVGTSGPVDERPK